MLPAVASIHSFDFVRDGSSFMANFYDGSNVFHTLEFRARTFRHPEGPEEILGWDPFLEAVHPLGKTFANCRHEPIQVSWAESCQLLNLLSSMVGESASNKRVFARMQEIASTDGRA